MVKYITYNSEKLVCKVIADLQDQIRNSDQRRLRLAVPVDDTPTICKCYEDKHCVEEGRMATT